MSKRRNAREAINEPWRGGVARWSRSVRRSVLGTAQAPLARLLAPRVDRRRGC